MLFVLSPAKTLDYNTPAPTVEATVPAFMSHSSELIEVMRSLSPAQIAGLMRISDPLAQLNAIRYASWAQECTRDNAKQAVFAFNGDVYEGLHAASLDSAALQYAQSRIRILSGLYGLLRPLDLMQAYRLEMGTPLANSRGRNLYAFWGDTITHALNAMAEEHAAGMLVNLASEEYFKSVRVTALRLPVITPVFEDWKAGRYKVISFHAKRGRGLMARYAAQNRLTSPEQLAAFDLDGYAYDPSVSTDAKPVFRRKQVA